MESFTFKDSNSKLQVDLILSQSQKGEFGKFEKGGLLKFFRRLLKYKKISLSLFLIVAFTLVSWYDERQLKAYFLNQKTFLKINNPCLPKAMIASPALSIVPIFPNESFYKLKWIAILQDERETVTWWKNQAAEVVSVKADDYLGKEKIQIKRVDANNQFLEAVHAGHLFQIYFNQRESDEYKAP